MKTRKYSAVIVMLCACLVVSTAGVGQDKYEGHYLIYTGDRLTDNDLYDIVTGRKYNDIITSASADGKEQEYELMYREDGFQYYQCTLNGLKLSKVSADGNILSFYDSASMVAALPVEGSVIVGEPAVYSHYTMMLKTYDGKKGGKQSFDMVMPSQQDFIQIEIERHGADAIKLSDRNLEAAHYRVVLGKKKEIVNAWVDGRRVIGLYFASKNRYVIDAGYDNLYDQIKNIVNRAL